MNALPRDDSGALVAYAWPGGYPVLYLDSHCCVLCPACAREHDNVEAAEFGDAPTAAYLHYEGAPEICDACGAGVESAYGEPDDDA